MLVAWAYNGIASALGHLGRVEEARSVLSELWNYDPFYPNALDTAGSVGAPLPTNVVPRGNASSLRLSLAQQLYENDREAGFRATAVAMSFVWDGQHVAAVSMAELGAKLPGPNPAWPRAIAEYARAASRDAPGTFAPLPAGSISARLKAAPSAHKKQDRAALRALRHHDGSATEPRGLASLRRARRVGAEPRARPRAASTRGSVRCATGEAHGLSHDTAALARDGQRALRAPAPRAPGRS